MGKFYYPTTENIEISTYSNNKYMIRYFQDKLVVAMMTGNSMSDLIKNVKTEIINRENRLKTIPFIDSLRYEKGIKLHKKMLDKLKQYKGGD